MIFLVFLMAMVFAACGTEADTTPAAMASVHEIPDNSVRSDGVAVTTVAQCEEVMCEPGPMGVQGEMGPMGVPGAPGAQGPQGATGPAGPQGLQGGTGDVGVQGPQGDPGTPGAPGAQGDTGDSGPQGAKGDSGDTGDPGAQGDKGDKGDSGDTGDSGPQGPQGVPGSAGAAGSPFVWVDAVGKVLNGFLPELGTVNSIFAVSTHRVKYLDPATNYMWLVDPFTLQVYATDATVYESGYTTTNCLGGLPDLLMYAPAAMDWAKPWPGVPFQVMDKGGVRKWYVRDDTYIGTLGASICGVSSWDDTGADCELYTNTGNFCGDVPWQIPIDRTQEVTPPTIDAVAPLHMEFQG